MLPYVQVADRSLGPITLSPFWLLAAAGVVAGVALATRRGRQVGVAPDALDSFLAWTIGAGFVGAHVLGELLYRPQRVLEEPWSLLLLWDGLSSFGGFGGAVIGGLAWSHLRLVPRLRIAGVTIRGPARRRPARPVLLLCDVVLSVFPVGWALGRAGCSLAHDHPGARAPADSLLAVAYGHAARVERLGPIELRWGESPRYDLGTLELLFTLALAAAFAPTWRRRLPAGAYVAASSLAYAPARFAMDGLRARDLAGADPRYLGLTPAQWACLALFALGAVMLCRIARRTSRSGLARPRLDDVGERPHALTGHGHVGGAGVRSRAGPAPESPDRRREPVGPSPGRGRVP